jgi:hypothetical protein
VKCEKPEHRTREPKVLVLLVLLLLSFAFFASNFRRLVQFDKQGGKRTIFSLFISFHI